MSPEPHNRRWYQFRLRTLLILVMVLAIPLAWLAYERQKVQERNAWLELLKQHGASIGYGKGPPDQPAWLRYLLGDDLTVSVTSIIYARSAVDVYDDDLAYLAHCVNVESVNLHDARITDAGLAHLSEMTKLTDLNLAHTQVTDSGLIHLAGLNNLHMLNLKDTQITDVGLLYYLAGMPKLEFLHLDGTQATEAGRRNVRVSRPGIFVTPLR